MSTPTNAHDVLVILPLEEELEAFRQTLCNLKVAIQKTEMGRYAVKFALKTRAGVSLNCAAATISKEELFSATTTTQKLIGRFNPKHVIVCGIAMTGLSRDALPGHVTIASAVYGLHSKKNETYALSLVEHYSRALAQRFYHHSQEASFMGQLRAQCEVGIAETTYQHDCRFHFAKVVCGPELISGSEARRRFAESNLNLRDTGAYDMESHLILQGCGFPKSVPAVVIRGLSDDGADKDVLPSSLRSRVVAYCACLVIDALENDVLYSSYRIPPTQPPYRNKITVLNSAKVEAPFDRIGESAEALGMQHVMLGTDSSLDTFIDNGEKSRAVVVCIDKEFLKSAFFRALYHLDDENNSSLNWRQRFKASSTGLYILQLATLASPVPPMGATVIAVHDQETLAGALRLIHRSIQDFQSEPAFSDFQDGFKVSEDRVSIFLDCNGNLRSLRWSDQDEDFFKSLNAQRRSAVLTSTEKLYRVFRDIQQCLLHADLTTSSSNLAVSQVAKAASDHLKHGIGIAETKGKSAILEYTTTHLAENTAAAVSSALQASVELMNQAYNSTFSCLQKIYSEWQDNSVIDYGRVNTLCLLVEGTCHWLLSRQRELSKG